MTAFKIEKLTQEPISPFEPNTLYLIKDANNKVTAKISSSDGATIHGVSTIDKVSLDGPLAVVKNTMVTYVINDFDINRAYNVSVVSGTVNVFGSVLEYTAPNTAGASSIIINSRVFNITIVEPIVIKPTIVAPVQSSTDVNVINTNAECSAFTITDGATDTYEASDWQLSTDISFINIIDEITASASNEITWNLPALSTSTTYYLRTRHKGVALGYSEWSTPLSFTTANFINGNVELAIISNGLGLSTDNFGYVTDITRDGTRAFVSAFFNGDTGLTDPGIVYIYRIESYALVYENELTAVSSETNDLFGNSVSSSNDGSVLVVGCANDSYSSYTKSGSIYIYTRTDTTWLQTQQLFNPNPANNVVFGNSVSVSGDGNTIVVGAPTDNHGEGAIYVYEKSGPVWVLAATLTPPNVSGDSEIGYNVKISNDGLRIVSGCYYGAGDQCTVYFRNEGVWEFEANLTTSAKYGNGFSVSINNDGTTIAIGSCYEDVGSGPYSLNAGKVFIYTRTGSIWSLQATLTSSDVADNDYFGSVVELTETGDKLIVSSRNDDYGAYNNAGSVYVFTRNNELWSEQYKVIPEIPISSFSFGSSLKSNGAGSLAIIGSNNVTANVSTGGNVYLNTLY